MAVPVKPNAANYFISIKIYPILLTKYIVAMAVALALR
jgi:hypothetical protein